MNKYPLFLLSEEMRPFLIVLMILDIILRGMALYKSARKSQNVWFVALLIVNSLGVLPLIYLLIQSAGERKSEASTIARPVTKKVLKIKKRSKK